jgi:hypothetical protein
MAKVLTKAQFFSNIDFDTVLMPVNPAEQKYKSFIDVVLPLAREK